jgi:hypothetical protein
MMKPSLLAEIRANQVKTDTNLPIIAEIRTCEKDGSDECLFWKGGGQDRHRPETNGSLDYELSGKTKNLEANSEGKDAAGEQQEVPDEEAAVETIGALKDQYGDRRLAVWRHGQLKGRTQSDGGPWNNSATAQRWVTCCAVPALCMGCSPRGPAKTTGYGIRGRSGRQELYEALLG